MNENVKDCFDNVLIEHMDLVILGIFWWRQRNRPFCQTYKWRLIKITENAKNVQYYRIKHFDILNTILKSAKKFEIFSLPLCFCIFLALSFHLPWSYHFTSLTLAHARRNGGIAEAAETRLCGSCVLPQVKLCGWSCVLILFKSQCRLFILYLYFSFEFIFKPICFHFNPLWFKDRTRLRLQRLSCAPCPISCGGHVLFIVLLVYNIMVWLYYPNII